MNQHLTSFFKWLRPRGLSRRLRRPLVSFAVLAFVGAGYPLLVNANDVSRSEPGQPRLLYMEEITFIGDEVRITMRAARKLKVTATSWGGPHGDDPVFSIPARPMEKQEATTFIMPLNGPTPSLIFHWGDHYGNRSAITLRSDLMPYPLPTVDTNFCRLRVNWLRWRPGTIEGGVQLEDCVSSTTRVVPAIIEQGYVETRSVNVDRAVYPQNYEGTLTVTHPGNGHQVETAITSAEETQFILATPTDRNFHNLTLFADITTNLNVSMPHYVNTVHFPAWSFTYTARSTFLCGTAAQDRNWTHNMQIPAHTESHAGKDWTSNQDWPEQVALHTGIYADSQFQVAPDPTPLRSSLVPGVPINSGYYPSWED